jgi:hypothetical protein
LVKFRIKKPFWKKKSVKKTRKGRLVSEYVLSYKKTWWNFYGKKLRNSIAIFEIIASENE